MLPLPTLPLSPLTSLLYETVGAAGASVVVTAMLLQASPKTAAARLSGQM